jgi:hypothetical protein
MAIGKKTIIICGSPAETPTRHFGYKDMKPKYWKTNYPLFAYN